MKTIRITSDETIEIDGKKYRPVASGDPGPRQSFISGGGKVLRFDVHFGAERLIVEEVIEEWITPTDEDALRRPVCEVRDRETSTWHTGYTLYGVVEHATFPFIAHGSAWRFCRIRNPALD